MVLLDCSPEAIRMFLRFTLSRESFSSHSRGFRCRSSWCNCWWQNILLENANKSLWWYPLSFFLPYATIGVTLIAFKLQPPRCASASGRVCLQVVQFSYFEAVYNARLRGRHHLLAQDMFSRCKNKIRNGSVKKASLHLLLLTLWNCKQRTWTCKQRSTLGFPSFLDAMENCNQVVGTGSIRCYKVGNL